MHLLECTWHTWGALLRNNMEGVSRNISSRIVTSAWWFFSLIVISIYTANLAAFLTVYNAYIPVSSAADLAYQSDYKYGTVEGSQIEFFFKNTQITHYAKMWAYMNITKGVQARRVENGLNKTRYEKYAFIWDSPTLRHMISTDCDLIEVGQPFDLKGYGIATKKHVPYTEKISFALLRLNDAQRLQALESKYVYADIHVHSATHNILLDKQYLWWIYFDYIRYYIKIIRCMDPKIRNIIYYESIVNYYIL